MYGLHIKTNYNFAILPNASPLLRDYFYEMNRGRYGDVLGHTLMLKEEMNNMIVLCNIEIAEHCHLDLETGKIEFFKDGQVLPKFMGTYFRDENTFFALYCTETGPMIYYKGESFPLRKNLHIKLKKKDPWRTFQIKEYNICIQYRRSRYIGLDVWSTEMDVDLFYQIKKSYKKDKYYESFTI